MSRVLPILFNTEMVKAILDKRKTVTRRAVKYKYSNTEMQMFTNKYGTRLIEIQKDIEGETHGKNPDGSTWHKLLPYIEKNPPYKKGDILYVRETWCVNPNYKEYYYKAKRKKGANAPYGLKWRPSIHMPKEAARIWLKVIDVRVERLQSITDDDCMREGIQAWTKDGRMYKYYPADLEGDYPNCEWSKCPRTPKEAMKRIWDSTIPKKQQTLYDWSANPWVWVIEFERCERPEPCIIKGIEPASDKRPCIGYQKSKEDDEPCEMCKGCKWCDGEEPESEG